ncbi:putative pre-mRNA-splicing factor ATP-dependent RNA helicase C20H4.09 [Homalodisca vitripennis]|uniref:putative pre-mRNA-splicing factor ATP-dependent RNA helicase C20H4.09 n=1 Tax=Homalodisca vitripennis TaxID=197043 RepID=UPI001EEAD503|nr:putative pre-mRNA-splicing factor ATP-dependent RNA helicase C20H4.09 [Homalodisca vitripennis]
MSAYSYPLLIERHGSEITKMAEKNRAVIIKGPNRMRSESLEYDYIIIDEVHERTARTDIILGVLRDSYKGRVIMMSASVDTEKLERYFGAKTYVIPGRSFPVEIKYLERPTSDYIAESYMTIRNILARTRRWREEGHPRFSAGRGRTLTSCTSCAQDPGVSVHKMHRQWTTGSRRRYTSPTASRG